jgi:hypothetical protein
MSLTHEVDSVKKDVRVKKKVGRQAIKPDPCADGDRVRETGAIREWSGKASSPHASHL